MALAKIEKVVGRGVPVPGDDIDTDRIIPARFLLCVTFDGLGSKAFYDVRFDAAGKPLGHPFDDPRFRGASILLSGRNFGCGSSREHAPQSLYYAGIRAIVAESFAEIFFGNATTLGIPCVSVSREARAALCRLVEAQPKQEIEIDLTGDRPLVRFGEETFAGELPESTRQALVAGEWDPLAQLLDGRGEVAKVEAALPRPAATEA